MLKQLLPEANEKISISIDDEEKFTLFFDGDCPQEYTIVDSVWFKDYEDKIKERTRMIFDTIDILLKNDRHAPGIRESCRTCEQISELIGRPFGCSSTSSTD